LHATKGLNAVAQARSARLSAIGWELVPEHSMSLFTPFTELDARHDFIKIDIYR
jgi:hypothetical protein